MLIPLLFPIADEPEMATASDGVNSLLSKDGFNAFSLGSRPSENAPFANPFGSTQGAQIRQGSSSLSSVSLQWTL